MGVFFFDVLYFLVILLVTSFACDMFSTCMYVTLWSFRIVNEELLIGVSLLFPTSRIILSFISLWPCHKKDMAIIFILADIVSTSPGLNNLSLKYTT